MHYVLPGQVSRGTSNTPLCKLYADAGPNIITNAGGGLRKVFWETGRCHKTMRDCVGRHSSLGCSQPLQQRRHIDIWWPKSEPLGRPFLIKHRHNKLRCTINIGSAKAVLVTLLAQTTNDTMKKT